MLFAVSLHLSLHGGMRTIDSLVDIIHQQNNSKDSQATSEWDEKKSAAAALAYTKDEMENVGTLLNELKVGFSS